MEQTCQENEWKLNNGLLCVPIDIVPGTLLEVSEEL